MLDHAALLFVPFAVETCGYMGKEAVKFVNRLDVYMHQHCAALLHSDITTMAGAVLHGESITDQASPRTSTQRTFQPQEAVQPQRNQTILQADTPAQ